MRHVLIDGKRVWFDACPEGKLVKRVGDKFVGVEEAASGGGSSAWGDITGTLANQADLQTALDAKAVSGHNHDASYATLAHAHSYNDLTDKPTLGDSSSKNVGTSAGTVAAGDHTHAGGGSALDAWPVGSVFIAVVSTSPATLLGGGTWVAFAAGKVLVGIDSADTDFDTAEETGGAKTVAAAGTVSQPTLTMDALSGGTRKGGTSNPAAIIENGNVPTGTVSQPTFTGSATSVVQPYITVYMWKRTA